MTNHTDVTTQVKNLLSRYTYQEVSDSTGLSPATLRKIAIATDKLIITDRTRQAIADCHREFIANDWQLPYVEQYTERSRTDGFIMVDRLRSYYPTNEVAKMLNLSRKVVLDIQNSPNRPRLNTYAHLKSIDPTTLHGNLIRDKRQSAVRLLTLPSDTANILRRLKYQYISTQMSMPDAMLLVQATPEVANVLVTLDDPDYAYVQIALYFMNILPLREY